jgi:hypothetical protein
VADYVRFGGIVRLGDVGYLLALLVVVMRSLFYMWVLDCLSTRTYFLLNRFLVGCYFLRLPRYARLWLLVICV